MFGALELVVTEMTVLAIGCLLLIRYYKGNMVTIDVTVSVYISWALGFVGVLLLPYDLSVALINRYMRLHSLQLRFHNNISFTDLGSKAIHC